MKTPEHQAALDNLQDLLIEKLLDDLEQEGEVQEVKEQEGEK